MNLYTFEDSSRFHRQALLAEAEHRRLVAQAKPAPRIRRPWSRQRPVVTSAAQYA